ncbi:MAG: metallophosphoesterase [Bacteroidetes bacterium]|nr:metallophosphoesterase [Bacteroidota bacterium]
MRSLTGLLLFLGFFLLLDLYFFQAVRHVSQSLPYRGRMTLYAGYWLVAAFGLVAMLYIFLRIGPPNLKGGGIAIYLFSGIFSIYLGKLVGVFPLIVDDLRRIGLWGYGKLSPQQLTDGTGISRATFLSWLGITVAGLLFGLLMWGRSNLYAYRVHRMRLRFPNLPPAFDGLRVVQLSDIHSGSLSDQAGVQAGIDQVLALKPDLILFTGDLVNDRTVEMTDWKQTFAQLKAPMGVYSVLGNHDYGEYAQWPSAEDKARNMADMLTLQREMGWKLLLNEHVLFTREDQQIALLGVENWSASARFVSPGDLPKAYAGTENVPFKVLMSHDPSHWDAEIRTRYPDIDLTLAGHTHGMQFGVELSWLKWSPVKWLYKQWAGLYTEGRQYLYVNRGFGFIGYQGRVGIRPEITLIELRRS